MQGNLQGAMLQATPFLTLFGTVVLGLHAVWQARVALEQIDAGATPRRAQVLQGQGGNARFYAKNILPAGDVARQDHPGGDESCLEDGLFD